MIGRKEREISVLLVEDNPGDAVLVRETLAEAGSNQFKFMHVDRLGAALELLGKEKFDVVLLDLSLPDAQQLEGLTGIQASYPHAPIVVLTGLDDSSVALKSVQEGAQDYLVKGKFDCDLLARAIRYAIERNRLRLELEKTRQQQLKMKDQFLSHVSHELRSPLTAIYEFVTILLDGLAGELSPEQREYLEITLKNAKQLRTMIGDLLEVTRTESGTLIVEPCPTGIAELIADALRTLQPSASARGIAMLADLPGELPPVYADPSRASEILVNLIDNAIKFTPEKGRITVRAQIFREDPGFLCVAVADTGCGISPEDSKRIFEYLYQGENTSEVCRKGLGLGLYICRELVSRQGGRIWFESQPGEGSVFYFTLPIFSLARFLLPLITENNHLRDSIALITVDVFPAGASPSVKVEETMRQEIQDILQRCIIPVRDVLLPKTVYPGKDETLFIVVSTNENGAEVVVQRIQEQLALYQGLQNTNFDAVVSFTMVDAHSGKDTKSMEQLVDEVAKSIEDRVNIMFHKRRNLYEQKKNSHSG